MLGLDVTCAEAESLHLVVTDEGAATRTAHNDAAGLGDHGAATFLDLAPFVAEVVEAARTLHRGWVRRQRCEILDGGRRCRQRRGHLRRRPANGRRRGAGRGGGALVARRARRLWRRAGGWWRSHA